MNLVPCSPAQPLSPAPRIAPLTMEEMYPHVPAETLVGAAWQKRFREYFLDSGEFSDDPFAVGERTHRPQRKCIAVCLFRQNVDNRSPHEFPVHPPTWHTRYWVGLQNVVQQMQHFPEWKLRIFVERELWDEVHSAFADHPQVELYRMRVNSIGANPGSLWRFLALDDRSLDLVLETDVDEALTPKLDLIRTFEMDSRAAVGRIGGFVSDRQYRIAPGESAAKNYATMIGSCVMSRPQSFDFDIADAMRGFMAYRRHMSESERPWAYSDTDQPSVYNQPIGGHIHGWGSHWYMYCFDERFLKHVLYYHFAERSQLHTWASSVHPFHLDPEGASDLAFTRSRGNVSVWPHSAARLSRLGLSDEALRIAFTLDEYRWIFDALLQLMRQHAAGGVCGNLFFHDIADPYCVDLVPKQLNLFKAAQHASHAVEIGFNAGHSAAIMLLANRQLTIRAFDTCLLGYTRSCAEFLNETFGPRLSLVEGYSQSTVGIDPVSGYDLAHVDADHNYACVATDLANVLPRCAANAIVVMDDHEGDNDVARAARERTDLIETNAYTVCPVLPGSSHAIYRYTPII